jgi:hypothetical protein
MEDDQGGNPGDATGARAADQAVAPAATPTVQAGAATTPTMQDAAAVTPTRRPAARATTPTRRGVALVN